VSLGRPDQGAGEAGAVSGHLSNMGESLVGKLRFNGVFGFIAASMSLALAAMIGGCPSTGNGNGNGNDNTIPGTVAVTIAPAGAGTVEQTAVGALVRLTATAANGFLFDGWSGAEGVDQNANPITVDPTAVSSITANFIVDNTPPSPSDSDGDGVRDTVDECPNTPPGTPVDATGCEATGDDADSDGVPDSADNCANTAAGATVDAHGCAAAQRDTDNDGVNDALDQCPRTPTTVTVDARGCPVSAPGTPDDDQDGVANDIDQCPDTVGGATVDANGCADSQLDTDGDGVHDDLDQCPNTPERTTVDASGCPVTGGGGGGGGTPVCGNNTVETGEQCDDGNTTAGDGCSGTCQVEVGSAANDACATPTTVGDGRLTFNNLGATTDGAADPLCSFFNRSQVESDLWYVYTASCTGTAVFSLCGSDFDTKLAVYNGTGCPSGSPAACSDDDCGTGVENTQSRIELAVTAGQPYTLRVGAYDTARGAGEMTIACNVDACATSVNNCLTPTATGAPGCSDSVCCAATCAVDTFCCDVTWDMKCAGEAEGICDGHFAACTAAAGACDVAKATPGCSNVSCCDTLCKTDPFCCLTEWDATCVNEAGLTCLLACGAGAGACNSAHLSPGCDNEACCASVCTRGTGDEFCCTTEWDQLCVDLAAQLCR